MHKIKIYTIIFMATLSFISCKDEYSICNENKNVLLQTNFYRLVNGAAEPFSPSSFSLYVLHHTQPIYHSVSGVNSFVVSLNPTIDSTVFQISSSTTAPLDTLVVLYSTTNVPLSPACGTVNFQKLLRVYSTHHSIDSIAIAQPEITNEQQQNIKLFY